MQPPWCIAYQFGSMLIACSNAACCCCCCWCDVSGSIITVKPGHQIQHSMTRYTVLCCAAACALQVKGRWNVQGNVPWNAQVSSCLCTTCICT
jgi:hypothetical protein